MIDTIGIQSADGRMFPLFASSFRGKKRVQLTKTDDKQDSLAVKLFGGEGQEMRNAAELASLQLEDIGKTSRSDAEIVLEIGIDSSSNLNATITEGMSGRHDGISVQLHGVAQATHATHATHAAAQPATGDESQIPVESGSDLGLDPEISYDTAPQRTLDRSERHLRRRRRVTTTLAATGFVIVGLIILAVGVYFVFQGFRSPDTPPIRIGLGG